MTGFGIADRGLEQALGVGRRVGHDHLQARDMAVPGGIVLAVLGGDARGRTVRAAEDDRRAHLAARHVERLGGRIDDLVDRLHGEVEGHEFDDRLQPGHRRADADAGKAVLGDRRVDDAPRPEFLQQALRDLVGALVLGDLLAHDEDVRVAAHLFGHGVAQRFAHGGRDHFGAGRNVGIGSRFRLRRGRDRRSRRGFCLRWRSRRFGRSVRFRGRAPCRQSPALSPSCSSTAIGVLTLTPSVPAAIRILPSVPSSTASTSIVALSVSISAMTSPATILSPSFFSHLARLPSSIVGESAGIRISIGISAPSLRVRCRSRARTTSGSGSVCANSAASATMSRTSLSIALSSSSLAHFFSSSARLDLLDRVVLGAHLLHFFLGAVLGRVGHRVAAIAVGLHLEDDRPVARAAPFGRDIGGRLHRAHIHAVDLQAGNAEGDAALREIGLGRRARHGRAHRVAVVLDDVDDRQLPQRRHVEAFVDLALVGRAVAEIGQRDIVVLAIAVGEGEAGAERHLRADDAVAAVEILLLGEHVHGAALALGIAAATPGEFGHDAARRHAPWPACGRGRDRR